MKRLSARAEFILVTFVCFSYAAVNSASILLSGIRHVEITTGGLLWSIVIELAIVGIFAAILRARGWPLRQRLGLEFSWKAAAAGVPLFILYLLLYYITATFVLLVFPAARQVWVFSFTNHAPFALMLLFIVVNSIFEEVTVTGYVIEALGAQGAGVAITASTLLRFSYHLYQGPLASLSVIPLGLLFATMFWRWRNLWPLIVAHTIANVVFFLLNPQGVSAAR
ncbi:MAG TPA: CPBP family intramembrane glutamic endopeptidase [Thermoanaerobaculia bacterium]|nr:CPBP family intramembrane glutamic endopeptidase [Thermoanaerobaculia bacterium]